ncbi:HK97 gp10 family phage protein [Rossellomorea vietnamensis]|uniref:HK97 gp10 family phage protein n=1 Tax=Rossellomorea vietnamensis TaxID=218284 RepID=A0A5D4MDI1_9BACI|nr:HK97-gp10 family putative phage morphogenesis protein [Rossellomorea vietnamensis]TYR99075.1 HK97 gp10 family phage protein [Rossellomorea vietnamensis]
MDLDGLDALLSKLDRMDKEIEDDVGTIVKNNTIEMTEKTIKNAVFTQGYQTGYTKRNIETQMVSKLVGKTVSKSEHSGYLEFGTRFMDAQPFVFPGFFIQKKQFLEDMERLVK